MSHNTMSAIIMVSMALMGASAMTAESCSKANAYRDCVQFHKPDECAKVKP